MDEESATTSTVVTYFGQVPSSLTKKVQSTTHFTRGMVAVFFQGLICVMYLFARFRGIWKIISRCLIRQPSVIRIAQLNGGD